MDFGRINDVELEKINFELPPDPTFNLQTLDGSPVQNPSVYVGLPKWGSRQWIEKLYPEKTKEKDFLAEYSKHYNSIEFNPTHYKLYNQDEIRKWAMKVSRPDFKFCPKVFKEVSHYGSFTDKGQLTKAFLESIRAFGHYLGPVFLQVSDKFSPKRSDEVFNYLESLPRDLQFFLEVRHPEWFSFEIREEMFDKLRSLNVGAVITDTPGRRDCCHMHLTLPKAFIRYMGNGSHPTDYTRCRGWVERIKYRLQKGLKELYFFLHVQDENPFAGIIAVHDR